jgi:hypothetical protein
VSESETLDLHALGVLMRRMQGELRAIGSKLDLLSRGRDRDAASFATRDDLRDVVEVLTAQLGDFDTRISSVVGQMAQHMDSHGKMLADILDRLPPTGARRD